MKVRFLLLPLLFLLVAWFFGRYAPPLLNKSSSSSSYFTSKFYQLFFSGNQNAVDHYLVVFNWAPGYCQLYKCNGKQQSKFYMHGVWPENASGGNPQPPSPDDPTEAAVLKQFGAGGYGGSDGVIADEAVFLQHQKLEKLYISTRATKHFQGDIVRCVEGYIVTGSKQVEIGTKLSEDSRKYGGENTCTSGSTLSKVALSFARACAQIEKERGHMLKALGTQVPDYAMSFVGGTSSKCAWICKLCITLV